MAYQGNRTIYKSLFEHDICDMVTPMLLCDNPTTNYIMQFVENKINIPVFTKLKKIKGFLL